MTLDQAIVELRKRNQKVPIPLRLPTRKEVEDCERRLGVRFPQDLVHYLLNASDIIYGTKEPVTITRSTAHTHLETVANDAWDTSGLPKNLTPICEDKETTIASSSPGESCIGRMVVNQMRIGPTWNSDYEGVDW